MFPKLCAWVLCLLASPLVHAVYYRVEMTGPGTLVSDEYGLFGAASDVGRGGEVRIAFSFDVPDPASKPPYRSYFELYGDQVRIEIEMFGRAIQTGVRWALLEFDQYQPGDFSIYGAPRDGPGALPGGYFGFGIVPGPSASGHYPGAISYPNALGAGIFSFSDGTFTSTRDTSLEFTDYRPAVVSTVPLPSTLALLLLGLGLTRAVRRRS